MLTSRQVDPAIAIAENYSAYETAIEQDIVLHYENGTVFRGVVWYTIPHLMLQDSDTNDRQARANRFPRLVQYRHPRLLDQPIYLLLQRF